ncbi:protein containing an Alanine Racemase Domain [Yersinia aldovae]|nr:hypothetical protein [Yersinia aldovae]CNH59414.1 protein containing an Alanine Racemase Domain [Yersinia aldovae]
MKDCLGLLGHQLFLKTLLKQNARLIDAALSFWQQGPISPDSYVIDVKQTEANARQLLKTASHYNIKLYLMSKQFGHNPELCRRLRAYCYEGINNKIVRFPDRVAVDFKEAHQLHRHAISVAHIGHRVQPPSAMGDDIVSWQPEVITVFSLEKALENSQAASRHCRHPRDACGTVSWRHPQRGSAH